MEDKLRLNNNFIGFDGIIGRREYFLNLIYIMSISLVFSLPYSMWLITKVNQFSDYFCLNKLFFDAPFLLKLWIVSGTILSSVIFISNAIRRLNDINGDVRKNVNIICSSIFVISAFGFLLPPLITSFICFISFIISIILLFKKGKITSKFPIDAMKEFNWGAFCGTWIWGLFNKSYIPLLYLILFFTPWGLYFQIYCGLKGNEWAYKNKKWKNISEFNKSQEKQTVIWLILYFIVLPFIFLIISFGATMFGVSYLVKSNNARNNVAEKLENTMKSVSYLYFESYKIEDNENKFYVKPEDWNAYQFMDKKKIFDFAANIAALERSKQAKLTNSGKNVYFSKTSELKRTKIYSTKNSQLLGEYINQKDNKIYKRGENTSVTILKEITYELNAYKFYNAK